MIYRIVNCCQRLEILLQIPQGFLELDEDTLRSEVCMEPGYTENNTVNIRCFFSQEGCEAFYFLEWHVCYLIDTIDTVLTLYTILLLCLLE